ncbi:MAG TPA: SDR family NAD(P)-dependent oxidoreductase [Aliidongia sp.]|nr:SDR family NAD(P)-dependent oxidoreductase [Aliidongia sp.]
METESKVVLVTGASSGLGQATAAFLAGRGHRVYGTSRKPSPVDTGWPMLTLDVCSDASVAACVAEIERREGRIDALVNNAGHAFVGAIEETSLDEAKAQFETNFFGALRMMRAVLPLMRARDRGRIVNVSSLAGAVPFPFLGLYGASKHALEAVSESLDYELAGTGIRVTILEPDGMRTAIGFHHPKAEHPVLAEPRRRLLALLEAGTSTGGQDPLVLAREVARAIEDEVPPLRIVIGEMANQIIAARRSMPEASFRRMISESVR